MKDHQSPVQLLFSTAKRDSRTVLQSSARKINSAFVFLSHLRRFLSTLSCVLCSSLSVLSRLCALTGLKHTLLLQGPLAGPYLLSWRFAPTNRLSSYHLDLKRPVWNFPRNFVESLVTVNPSCHADSAGSASQVLLQLEGAAWQSVGTAGDSISFCFSWISAGQDWAAEFRLRSRGSVCWELWGKVGLIFYSREGAVILS